MALEKLDLSNNKLTIVDGNIASLKSLKELKLNGCQLVTQPPTVFSEGMVLEKLDLSHNKLTIVDGNFASLKSLKELYLSRQMSTRNSGTHSFQRGYGASVVTSSEK